jgi:hypothetical protein
MIVAETKRIMQRGGDTKPLAIFDKVFATPHADTNQPPSVVAAMLQGSPVNTIENAHVYRMLATNASVSTAAF